jgi:hypothetical protein
MKKFLLLMSGAISLALLIHITGIFIYDLARLTAYGYGYLFGKLIMLTLFLSVFIFTYRKLKAKGL